MKKKGKSKRTRETLSPETASAVEGLLEEIQNHENKGESLGTSLERIRSQFGTSLEKDLAIVTALGGGATERMARLLHALLDSISDKRVLKAVRRSLYRIEQRGIPIEPVEEKRQGPSVLRPLREDRAEGFISAVDSEGSQIVFVTLSRKPKGLYLLQGIVSDTRGLIEFNRAETTKRGFREFYESFKKPGQLPIVDVDAGYCRFLLEQAAQLTDRRGESVPASYSASKRELEKVERLERHPVFRFLDEGEIQENPRLLKSSTDLFQIDWFSSWFLPREEVQKYAQLVEEAEGSRLVLNPAQKETRLQEAYRKALTELLTEERRLLYKRRLEEMAYVLLREGREGNARAALAASIDLRSPLNAFDPNPFLLNLVTRSIYSIVAQEMEKKEAEPSLIVKP